MQIEEKKLSEMLGVKIQNDRITRYDRAYALYTVKERIFDDEKVSSLTRLKRNWIKSAIDKDVSLILGNKVSFVTEESNLQEKINELIANSNFNILKYAFVKNIVLFGDGFLKLETNEETGETIIRNINPYFVKDLECSYNGEVKKIELEYSLLEEEENKEGKMEKVTNLYNEIYTLEKIEKYKNEEIIDTIDNSFGIIPFIHVPANQNLEEECWGENYTNDIYNTIKTLTEYESILGAILKTYANPLLVHNGTAAQQDGFEDVVDELSINGGTMNGISLNIDEKLQYLEPIKLPEEYKYLIEKLEKSIEENIPEFVFSKMQKSAAAGGNGITLEILVYDLKSKIQELQDRISNHLQILIKYYFIIENINSNITDVELQSKVNILLPNFFDFRKYEREQVKQMRRKDLIELLKIGVYTNEEFKQELDKVENPRNYGLEDFI